MSVYLSGKGTKKRSLWLRVLLPEFAGYRLEHDPRFLARIAAARKSLGEGKGLRLKDLPL